MAVAVTMPKLGLTMTQGKVVKWLRGDGEQVAQGDPIVVVMTKKITSELQAPASGILRIIVQPQESRTVGVPLGFILQIGEAMPDVAESALALPPTTKRDEPAPPVTVSDGPPREVRASPAAKRLARELSVEIARVVGTGGGGRTTESDVQAFHDQSAAVDATPLARRMMEEEGLDASQIAGSGPQARITEDDVLAALNTQQATPRAALPAPAGTTTPFSGIRQAIAETMLHSLHSMAQLTLTAKADVTELVALRENLQERWDERISYTDFIVKATALALREHPLLNSMLAGEAIVAAPDIHIGVAVALDGGLIVPVVRNVDRESVRSIHRTLHDLTAKARAGQLSVDEVTGSTFTVTNLGMYGIEGFTPIINPPEAAILGVGRIAPELALVDGQVVARSKMVLSLTIDHRIVDGAPGAMFLQSVVRLLEQPVVRSLEGPAIIIAAEGA